MNEQEIISCLKENRKKGVGFAFMPSEVQEWCRQHCSEKIFRILDEGEWPVKETPIMCRPDSIYCVDADYEPKPEFKPDWQEFDIEENGYFYYEGKEYYYRDDVTFERRNSDTFKGFGGWLYDNGNGRKFWTTFLHVIDKNGVFTRVVEPDVDVRPIYPTKIRFWKYRGE